ncbi:MAG TPA: hypothetical protein VIJ96_02960 [Acidothermaceae bacterium]
MSDDATSGTRDGGELITDDDSPGAGVETALPASDWVASGCDDDAHPATSTTSRPTHVSERSALIPS